MEVYTQVRSKAPTLWLFFRSVISEPGDDTAKDEHNGSFALIAALLCHALAPILSNSFQAHMGIQFHSLGGRRVLLKFCIPCKSHSVTIVSYATRSRLQASQRVQKVSVRTTPIYFRIASVKPRDNVTHSTACSLHRLS